MVKLFARVRRHISALILRQAGVYLRAVRGA